MDALDLLTEQHDEVEKLFDKIEATSDPDEKQDLFDELADKIAAHSAIEEKLFYPSVKTADTEDMLLESVEEHLAVKRLLADLLETDVEDEQFDAKLKVMKESIDHHAREEEEGKLFPKVKRLLGAEDREALGGEMAAMFETLLEQHPRNEVPSQTDHAAPI